MTASPDVPELSIVVSTIGRPGPLSELLASLGASRGHPSFELVVVDQSEDQSCLRLLAESHHAYPVVGTRSARGACHGRNVGACLARGRVLTFPDDNAFYLPDTLGRAWRLLDTGLAALSGIQTTRRGEASMLRWLPDAADVTARNIQRTAIESGVFIRSEVFHDVGGFDEGIGVGSAGPYQAGEITDLLMRVMARGGRVRYDPRVVIVSDDPRDTPLPGFDQKMLGYGRGMGRLYRVHPLPLWQLGYYVGRKLVAAPARVAKGRPDLARADLAWARGAASGFASGRRGHPSPKSAA